MTEDKRTDPEVTSQVKRSQKPHDKFRMSIQFAGLPLQLNVEAKDTHVELKELRRNPKKHSFGKVQFKDGFLEACIYPLSTLDSILWFLRIDSLNKSRFIADNRKTREILALIMRTRYYLGLIKDKKLKYLRKKGYFANINMIKDNLTIPEKKALQSYGGITRVK